MKENWKASMRHVKIDEGGFVNNPNDNGGPTNKGVTLRNFRAYVKPNGSLDDLKNITDEQVAVFFKKSFWDEVGGDFLPSGLDYAVFDTAIHSGPFKAVTMLQQVLGGIAADGEVGPITLGKIAEFKDIKALINAYMDARMAFLKRLGDWQHFGNGWTNRVKGVKEDALSMVGLVPETIPTKVELEEKTPPKVDSAPAPKLTIFDRLKGFLTDLLVKEALADNKLVGVISELVKNGLVGLGGTLVTGGWISEDQNVIIAGAISTLAGVAWTVVSKSMAKKVGQ